VNSDSFTGRSFKLAFQSVENCAARCAADDACAFFSVNEGANEEWCIGCDVEPTRLDASWTTYDVQREPSRRRLSEKNEIEALRKQNEVFRNLLNL